MKKELDKIIKYISIFLIIIIYLIISSLLINDGIWFIQRCLIIDKLDESSTFASICIICITILLITMIISFLVILNMILKDIFKKQKINCDEAIANYISENTK